VSLIHLRYDDGGVWCLHHDPQAWTSDVREVSCCDCVLSFMSDELRKVRAEKEGYRLEADRLAKEWARAEAKGKGEPT
jgi:hypothetical protein